MPADAVDEAVIPVERDQSGVTEERRALMTSPASASPFWRAVTERPAA